MLGCFGFVVAFAWSLMMPHMRGPDEFLHVDVIYEMNSAHSFSADKDYHPHSRVFVAQRIADHGDVGALHGLASEAMRRGRRPAFTAPPDTRSQLKNQLSQHPPVGWALPAIGAELVGVVSDPADWPYDQYLLLLRFFNALHMAAVGPLLYLALLRFKARHSVAVFAALLPLAIPEVPYITGVVSNDGMLLVVGALFAYLCARVATDDFSSRTSGLFGLVLGLGLLTKAWGLLLFPTVAFVYAAQVVVHKQQRLRVAMAGLITLVTGTAVGGWWWIRNLVVEGTLQPHHAVFPPTPPGFVPAGKRFWVERATSWLTTRFWGWFGTFAQGVRLPIWVVVVATVVAITLVVAGVVRAQRGELIFGVAAIGLFVVNSVEVLRQARALHVENSGWQGLQGRYMFIGVPMLAVVAALGAQRLCRNGHRWLPSAALSGIVAMQCFALYAALRAYWGPRGGSIIDSVEALAKWQAVGPTGLSVIFVLIATGAFWGVWVCRPGRSPMVNASMTKNN